MERINNEKNADLCEDLESEVSTSLYEVGTDIIPDNFSDNREPEQILREFVRGFTVTSATLYQKRMVSILQEMKINVAKMRANINREQLNDAVGRSIYYGLRSNISGVGKEFGKLISGGFKISEHLSAVRSKKDNKLQHLKSLQKLFTSISIEETNSTQEDADLRMATFQIEELMRSEAERDKKTLDKEKLEWEKLKCQNKHDILMKDKYNQRKEKLLKKNEVMSKIADIQSEVEYETIEEIILDTFVSCSNSICTKVNTLAVEYPFLNEKLTMRTEILATKEIYDNVLRERNLSGIVAVLKESYGSISLSIFSEMLTALVTFQVGETESTEHPYRAVVTLCQMLEHWQQMDAFNQCMTVDILFTVCLIGGYSDASPFKLRIVQHLTDLILDSEDKYKPQKGSSAMPLFTRLCTWVREHEKTKVMASGTRRIYPKEAKGNVTSYKSVVAKGTESAALVDVVKHTEVGSERLQRMTVLAGPYCGEVTRAHLIKVPDLRVPDKYHSYTATFDVCKECVIPENFSHSPLRCSKMQCSKCSMYGHHSRNCRQQISGNKK